MSEGMLMAAISYLRNLISSRGSSSACLAAWRGAEAIVLPEIANVRSPLMQHIVASRTDSAAHRPHYFGEALRARGSAS